MVLTFKEMINKRVVLLGILLTVLFVVFYGIGLHFVLQAPELKKGTSTFLAQQAGFQMLTLGLFCCMFLVGAMAVLVGSGSISREVETGTILNLVSRPLGRPAIVAGKYLASAVLSLVYSVMLFGSVEALAIYLFHLKINPASIICGLLFFSLLPLTILSVTTYCSTVLSTLAAGVIGFMLLALAIIGGFIEQIGAFIHSSAMVKAGVVTSLLMPTDAVYRLAINQLLSSVPSASIQLGLTPFGVVSLPSTGMIVYILIYVLLFLVLAIRGFSNRDL
ncbi:MAG: ABC transporter permease subunit [Syntrophomonadaceae bacterium]